MQVVIEVTKRAGNLEKNGLDFVDAARVFAGVTFDFEDRRRAYGETRMIAIGHLSGRMAMVGWTARGADRHVFTMRKCNEREQKIYAPFFAS